MGNRVYLQLHWPDPAETAVFFLSSNNGLPLFWMALLQPGDLSGEWESGARAALADGTGMTPIEPIRLPWATARQNLRLALDRSPARTPALAPLLRDWAAGLDALTGGTLQEAQLYLTEFAGFYDSADEFLAELRRTVAVWHGTGPLDLPPIGDAALDLTGYDDSTDLPFPRPMPEWQPDPPRPATPTPTRPSTGRPGWLDRWLGRRP